MVAYSEVGVLVGVVEVVASILIIYAHHGWHQQCIHKAVGNAGREGRGIKDLRLCCGEALLLRPAVGGVDAEVQSLLQFPLHVGMEVVALETGVQDNAVLIGIVC